jgi:hypothetical protein
VIVAARLRTGELSGSPQLVPTMALDYDVLDLGFELLDWSTDTPAGQERMAADLMLLAEVEQLTAAEGFRGPGRGRRQGLGWPCSRR